MIPEPVAAAIAPHAPERVVRIEQPDVGLIAYIVLDSTALGPSAGGVRTRRYPDEVAAAVDACRLARSMTYKAALGGLDAGGGKAVVLEHPALDRERAFERLGDHIEALGGVFRTAGDLGTTAADLAAIARRTRYVSTDTSELAAAVGRGVLRCAEAAIAHAGRAEVAGLTVVVQGAGDIGAAVSEAFAGAGASLFVADLDEARAARVAERTGATQIAPDDALCLDVDLVSPCAVGDVVDVSVASRLDAWAVVGGANNICADAAAHSVLHRRGRLFVPDLISSAGAVIDGIGRSVMGLSDRGALIDGLRETAHAVLADAAGSEEPPIVHAVRRAKRRIDRASVERSS